jgi:hypothetical protein
MTSSRAFTGIELIFFFLFPIFSRRCCCENLCHVTCFFFFFFFIIFFFSVSRNKRVRGKIGEISNLLLRAKEEVLFEETVLKEELYRLKASDLSFNDNEKKNMTFSNFPAKKKSKNETDDQNNDAKIDENVPENNDSKDCENHESGENESLFETERSFSVKLAGKVIHTEGAVDQVKSLINEQKRIAR